MKGSLTQYRVDFRPQGCIGLSIAGFAQSEKAANYRADMLKRFATRPIEEVAVIPVTYKQRGKRRFLERLAA